MFLMYLLRTSSKKKYVVTAATTALCYLLFVESRMFKDNISVRIIGLYSYSINWDNILPLQLPFPTHVGRF